MRIRSKHLLFIVVIFFLLAFFYKWKQKEFLGLTEPQIETRQTIMSYAKENGILGEILIAKDSVSYPEIKKYFDYGYLYVLDQNFNLIDCNIESYGGRCFQDIQSDICNGVKIQPRKFSNKINGKMIMEKLLENSVCITRDNPLEFQQYERIYLYTWVKYSKSCVNESSIKFIKCIKEASEKKSLLLTINSDSVR
ncbi:hypothetical protein [Flavobacterium sp.]|uniref:hypothetical protein n=1 Tax=Flavobacterium sp. TaxID=239 RepID=UPI002B4AE35F|nr:hypothetical protein [Flavobacterium sp.]HLP63212.1 hypothetical protein [Flavobacterium sp.]